MAAALADVTKSQVQRLYQAGMPRTVDAARAWRLANLELSRTADSRIDRPQTSARDTTTAAGASQGAERGTGDNPGAGNAETPSTDEPDPAEPQDEHTQSFRRDRAANERIKAERAQIELDQLRGSLIALREVEDFEFTAGRIVRDRIEMVPARVSADLHALVLSLVPEEHRAAIASALELHVFERRLADALREALDDAAKATEEARRDDDEDDPLH
jgi:hypothetical protein